MKLCNLVMKRQRDIGQFLKKLFHIQPHPRHESNSGDDNDNIDTIDNQMTDSAPSTSASNETNNGKHKTNWILGCTLLLVQKLVIIFATRC